MSEQKIIVPLGEKLETYDAPFPRFNKEGEVTGLARHIDNYKWMLDQYGITIKYNLISKEIDFNIPDKKYCKDNKDANYYLEILSLCEINKISSNGLTDVFLAIANENSHNPIKEYVCATDWDGEDRLSSLLDTVLVDDSMEKWKRIAIKKWLIGAYWMSTNEDGNRYIKSVLVLQGEQSIGKTPWFKNLLRDVPEFFDDGVELNVGNKDSQTQALSKFLVELGEFDSTTSKAHAGSLKAFLSKSNDKLRQPFAKTASQWPRRTAFCASVNPDEFLVDSTGNDRYWTIPVKSFNFDLLRTIDMQQLWAQVRFLVIELVKKDRYTFPWVLNKEEMDLMREVNSNFVQIMDVEQKLIDLFDGTDTNSEPMWQASLTSILKALGVTKINKSERGSLKDRLVRMFGSANKYRGVTGFSIPHPRGYEEVHMSNFGMTRRNPSVAIVTAPVNSFLKGSIVDKPVEDNSIEDSGINECDAENFKDDLPF